MSFAAIEAVDFPLAALRRLEAFPPDAPVALLSGESRKAVVTMATESARTAGVAAGMTAPQALAECADLRLRLRSPAAEREADALLLAAAWSLSPRAETTAAGLCTVDLSGRDPSRLPEDFARVGAALEQQGLPVRIGVAPNPLVARYAARCARPVLQVEDVPAFLAPLPVALLEPALEDAELLAALGLSTLGAVTAIPRAAFARRFGGRGPSLWARAAGEDDRPLVVVQPPERFAAAMDLPQPEETLEPLLFVLRRFVDRLTLELAAGSLAAVGLRLQLRLEDDQEHRRDFSLPEPTTDAGVLFRVLENHLATVQTEAPVTGLSLEAWPARPVARQDDLFRPGLRDAHLFFETLARLAAVAGSDRVGVPRHEDTHRPDAVALAAPSVELPASMRTAAPPARGLPLRRYRPPLAATVELTANLPTYVATPGASGPVKDRRGPWRISGDWWRPEAWAREEWDIELAAGGLYRLVRTPGGWLLEGEYA